MSNYAVLIATANVHPGSNETFSAWQAAYATAVSKFPGFISTDIVPPNKASDAWMIIVNFESEQLINAWQNSAEHTEILRKVVPLLESGKLEETISTGDKESTSSSDVTEVIFSKVRPGMADRYREWAGRIQSAQAKYPGYRGMYLQPPAGGKDGHWTSILRYDSAAHLEAWMNAPERKLFLSETKEFIESEDMMRLATSFPGWVPIDPLTGKGPPDWKTAMLVLLGLFPIVLLEMKFLSPVLAVCGFHASLATFIGNAISVALTSFITMPLFVRWFGWWLFPTGNPTATSRGLGMLVVLFALEVIALWNLLPW